MLGLGRSVVNPHFDERDMVPSDTILEGTGLGGGFLKKGFGKYGAAAATGGASLLLSGVDDEDEPTLAGGFLKKGFGKYGAAAASGGASLLLDGIAEGEDQDELAGIGIGALTIEQFKARSDELTQRAAALKARIAKLSAVKAMAVNQIIDKQKVFSNADKIADMAAKGNVAEGLLMVAERRMSAAEALVTNKEQDPVERPLKVEMQDAKTLYRGRVLDMKAQARAERAAAAREGKPAYYGHQETEFLNERKARRMQKGFAKRREGWVGPERMPARMSGLGDNIFAMLFRSRPMPFTEYVDRVRAVGKKWNDLVSQAGLLGPQQAQTFQDAAAKMTLAKYKGIPQAVEQITWDLRHESIEDVDTLKELETRVPILENLVKSMQASAPAPTQDGENARALEYMQSQLDAQIAEKQKLLAAQSGVGPLGVPWVYYGYGAGAAAGLGLLIYVVSR